MEKDQGTRDRLISATIEAVYRYGYSDATVARISEHADVSLGAIHHYFSSKEDLLVNTMRYLLEVMHKRVIEGTSQDAAPRAKLWAVIESVLGDEQSEDKITVVWLSFWVQAEYDEKLRRIRDLYNRRLYSNISSYLRQIFQEIGAKNIDERTRAGSFMLTAMMHGVWISYVTHEEWSDDISHGRLLVWECLEMLLSRSREILNPEEPTATIATSTTLLSDVSMEVIAADVGKIDQWIEYAPAGMTIYLPHFRGSTPLSDRIRMAGRLLDHGLCPVPHIAARNLRDKEELEQTIAGFTALGLKEFLLLGGGEPQPVGEFDAVIPVLQSGVLQHHQVEKVGFAGHPEDHPEVSRDVLQRALIEKIAVAKASQMDCYVVTQFCFAARPFFDFLSWMREQEFDVPVRLGIAGRVNAAKLFKFARQCGIGRSLSFARRQFGKTVNLVNYSPEGILAELSARIAVRDYSFPVGLHFYPFTATVETLSLVSAATVNQGEGAGFTHFHSNRGEEKNVH